MTYKHIPVMLEEAIEYLNIKKGGSYIDCTLGGGGYSFKISKLTGTNGEVVSFDLDSLAISNAKKRIKEENVKNITLFHDNFSNLNEVINEDKKFDGIVFDLGLSSAQLEDGSRGISFKNLDAPIDMGFNRSTDGGYGKTENILVRYKQFDLERIIKEYGEERFAKSISRNIVLERKNKKIKTVGDLVEIIRVAVPKRHQEGRIHFATKTFQALRIETNEEMKSLKKALPQALDLLNKRGRIVIVSYHSLEDRIVKQFFKKESIDCICPKEAPICNCGHEASLKIITKKPLLPKGEEIKNNPRARSAKLRVAEKL